jgi:hypothetical protein
MGTKKYTIRMGNPCNYGWENMTSTDKGRHCSQCDKVVMDFTTMNDTELIEFLLKSKNVCGHFNKSQLNRPIVVEGPKRFKLPHWPAIAAMLVAGMFVVAPSQVKAQTDQHMLHGNVKMEQPQKAYPRNTISRYSEKDSTITIGVKVIDSKTKKLLNATVTIDDITLESDKLGCYSLTSSLATLPKEVTLQAYANEYLYYVQMINVAEFRKKPYYIIELYWVDPNSQVDGGDIYIEPQH